MTENKDNQQKKRIQKCWVMLGPSLVVAILLLGGEPERDTFASHLAFDFHPPLEVFASSPGDGALERLKAVDRIGKLVLNFEAGRFFVQKGFEQCWMNSHACHVPPFTSLIFKT